MTRIILSRKGFDGGTGGRPSPIFPDGSIVSLPIPGRPANHRFCDVAYRGRSLGPLVEDLTAGRVTGATDTHLDPDLRADASPRAAGWRPIYGQGGAAQTHLARRGVGVGDLFLFFGWFRRVEECRGTWRYIPGAPNLHVLFGWLQIGGMLSPILCEAAVPDWARDHPHARPPYSANNTMYLASDSLRLGGHDTDLAGAGAFPRYHPDLCLTAPGQGRGTWRLPAWFNPASPAQALSYHADPARWRAKDGAVWLRTAGRGQEFVLDCAHYPEALAWAHDLLARHAPEPAGWPVPAPARAPQTPTTER